MQQRPQKSSGIDRALTVLLTPVVALWDLLRTGLFGMFALAERLDPFAASWRLLRKLAPWAVGVWRTLRARILPIAHRISIIFHHIRERIAILMAPVIRRVSPLVNAGWKVIVRVGRPIWAGVVAASREVRRLSAPVVQRIVRLGRAATVPVRRVASAIRRRLVAARQRR